jgi:hypothetical protein
MGADRGKGGETSQRPRKRSKIKKALYQIILLKIKLIRGKCQSV